jgi:hypothetical protein
LLRGAPSIQLKLVHLVRDGRGVAYSWTKEVQKPESVHAGVTMRRFHPARMGLRWTVYNLLFHGLALSGVPTIRVPYERFVGDARAEIERVLRFGGVTPDVPDAVRERSVRLDATHTVAGNPMRFRVGEIDLRVDDAWRSNLKPSQRRWVTTLSWPLLRAYGYVGRSGRNGSGEPAASGAEGPGQTR